MHLLSASILKLIHRPASRRTALVVFGILAFIYLSSGLATGRISDVEARKGFDGLLSFPAAYNALSGMLVVLLGIGGAAWAGAVAGGEWSWNTFRLAVVRGESRVRYVLITLLAVATLLLVVSVVLFAAAVAIIAISASLGGIPIGDAGDPGAVAQLPFMLAANWWAIALWATVSFAVAFIARSQVAGIAAVVGLYFLEQSAGLFAPIEIARLAPITAASSLAGGASQLTGQPDLLVPFALTTLYLLVAGGAVAFVANRTEVS